MDHLLRFLLLGAHEVGSGAMLPVLVLRICSPGEFYLGTFGEFYVAIDNQQMLFLRESQ